MKIIIASSQDILHLNQAQTSEVTAAPIGGFFTWREYNLHDLF